VRKHTRPWASSPLQSSSPGPNANYLQITLFSLVPYVLGIGEPLCLAPPSGVSTTRFAYGSADSSGDYRPSWFSLADHVFPSRKKISCSGPASQM
jgi:hypothetical protein